jgi:branched-subunit amino acid ABC-type transport system permease component
VIEAMLGLYVDESVATGCVYGLMLLTLLLRPQGLLGSRT